MAYMPPVITSSIQTIKRLSKIEKKNSFDREQLADAKLRVAIWVCRSEGLPATRSNVHVVLGEDSDFVFKYGNQALRDLELTPREREHLQQSRGVYATRKQILSSVSSEEKREAIERHAERKTKAGSA